MTNMTIEYVDVRDIPVPVDGLSQGDSFRHNGQDYRIMNTKFRRDGKFQDVFNLDTSDITHLPLNTKVTLV
jgi:hypothetical protein